MPRTDKLQNPSILATNLGKLRRQQGLSGEQAAARIGIKRTRLGHWETGVAAPNLEMIRRLCDLYGYKDIYKLITEVI